VQAAGLPDPVGPPLVHFSRRVDVMVGRGLPLIHERVEIE
jgi:hypothetical protein